MLTADDVTEMILKNGVNLRLDHTSASTTKNVYSCPFKQLCKMIQAPKGPTDTCHIDFGLALHQFIEEFYTKPDKDMTKEDLHARLSEVVVPKTKAKLQPTVDNFFAWEDKHRYRGLKPYNPKVKDNSDAQIFIEEEFLLSVAPDLPKVKGAVDLYCLPTGHLADWKTGKGDDFFKYGKDYPFGYVLQGVTYCVHESLMGRPVRNCEFFFTMLGRSGYINPRIDMSWLETTIRDMMTYIDKGVFFRNRNQLCNWCEYQMHCE